MRYNCTLQIAVCMQTTKIALTQGLAFLSFLALVSTNLPQKSQKKLADTSEKHSCPKFSPILSQLAQA